MSDIKFREKVLLGKTEAVYGVEESLDGSADAVLTRDLQLQPSKGDTEERRYDNGGLGHGVLQKTASHIGMTFKTDFAPSGAAGTAPAWGFLLKACGFDETIVADTSVTYAFANSADSLTLAYQNARNLHPGIGARGSMKLDLSAKKFPFLDFAMDALRVAPSDTAFPTIDQSAWNDPVAVNFANTTVAQLHGYDVCIPSCVIDCGNQYPVINVPGCNLVDITGRAPTANITILEPGIAEKDFYAIEESGALGNFQFTHGAGAGNVLKAQSAALTQITNLQITEFEGRTALTATLRFVDGDDGQSDFQLVNE